MYNIIGKTKIWFGLSLVIIVVGMVSIFFWGFNFSIDFTGGSLTELTYENSRPIIADVEKIISDTTQSSVQIQPVGEKSYIIRTNTLSEDIHQQVLNQLKEKFPDNKFAEDRFESIGPIIGQELKRKAILSIFIVLAAIIIYIAYAFRKVSKPVQSWKYGTAAIIALIHDLIVVVGLYSLISHFVGWSVDSLFITALLTILGFSVHDTIVVFDRIRETLKKEESDKFEVIVNDSINQTIMRSINTSFITLLVLTAIFLFGGPTIKHFILTLIIGITVGTYSSIFIASPILVLWNRTSKRG